MKEGDRHFGAGQKLEESPFQTSSPLHSPQTQGRGAWGWVGGHLCPMPRGNSGSAPVLVNEW